MATLVLGIRFACELFALAALAWWGHDEAGLALAIGLPVAAAVLWGAWVAPRARHRLTDPLRFAVESIVWAGAIAALIGVGRIAIAVTLGVLAIASAAAARRYEPPVVARSRVP